MLRLRLIDCPAFPKDSKTYEPGDCWYARPGGFRCAECGCLWRMNPPDEIFPRGSWSLYDADQVPGVKCCDNVANPLLFRRWLWWSDHEREVKPAGHRYAEIAPEHAGTRPMIVVLPTGATHLLQSPTYRDGKPGSSGWKVTGELPNVTVKPSINFGEEGSPFHWHGWITNGVFR